jgi:hypothetical protein
MHVPSSSLSSPLSSPPASPPLIPRDEDDDRDPLAITMTNCFQANDMEGMDISSHSRDNFKKGSPTLTQKKKRAKSNLNHSTNRRDRLRGRSHPPRSRPPPPPPPPPPPRSHPCPPPPSRSRRRPGSRPPSLPHPPQSSGENDLDEPDVNDDSNRKTQTSGTKRPHSRSPSPPVSQKGLGSKESPIDVDGLASLFEPIVTREYVGMFIFPSAYAKYMLQAKKEMISLPLETSPQIKGNKSYKVFDVMGRPESLTPSFHVSP